MVSIKKYLVVLTILSVALTVSLSAMSLAEEKKPEPRAVTPRGDLGREEKESIKVYQNCSPSVAYITTLALAQNIYSKNVFEIPKGTGSGFVWDNKGHIVTNYHVVENANKIQVALLGGGKVEKVEAELVGIAPDKDLAVLRIPTQGRTLTPVELGEAKNLLVGQRVYAIGNPFGLDTTMTSGIVSALNREVVSMTGKPIEGAIQTDAAINPGNSGGPLLDSAGRLIGINTAIYSPSGGSSGIGFALPVEVVNRVVSELIVYGRFIRPGIGISIAQDDILVRLGVQGVLVMRVFPGSPAQAAKMRETIQKGNELTLGDIIVSVDGKPVRNSFDLFNLFDKYHVGDVVNLGLLRGKDTVTVQIKLADIH